jgi:hypothetical protein
MIPMEEEVEVEEFKPNGSMMMSEEAYGGRRRRRGRSMGMGMGMGRSNA